MGKGVVDKRTPQAQATLSTLSSSSGGTKQFSELVAAEIDQVDKHKSESELHRTAKEKLAGCLRNILAQGEALRWRYADK
jgi:hypothetical protein